MGKVVSMIIRFASPARMNRTCSSAVAAIAAGFAVAGIGLTIGSHDVRAESWPASVDASYRINFNGFDIGSFQSPRKSDRTAIVSMAMRKSRFCWAL